MSDPLSVSDLFVFRVSQSMVATPLTPAEFADIARREGLVKLEGIDVDQMEELAIERVNRHLPEVERTVDHGPLCRPCLGVVVRHSVQAVVAALEGDTDVG